jgi:hypothetical protein
LFDIPNARGLKSTAVNMIKSTVGSPKQLPASSTHGTQEKAYKILIGKSKGKDRLEECHRW